VDACEIDMSTLAEYFGNWCWPRATAGAKLIFTGKSGESHKEHGFLACSASQCLSAYPVLGVFFNDVVRPLRPAAVKEINSFLKACDVLDILVAVSREGGVDNDLLRQAIDAHLAAHLSTYGDAYWIPKHHFAIHLADMHLRKENTLLACWVQERKHKVIKKWLKDRKTLTCYERSVLEEILLAHLGDLQEPILQAGLIDGRPAPKAMATPVSQWLGLAPDAAISTGPSVRMNGCLMSKNDLVLLKPPADWPAEVLLPIGYAVAHLWFPVVVNNGACSVIVSPWQYVMTRGETVILSARRDPRMLNASRLLAPLIHRHTADGLGCTVIMPASYRCTG